MIYTILIVLILLLIHANFRLRKLISTLRYKRSKRHERLRVDHKLLKDQVKILMETK